MKTHPLLIKSGLILAVAGCLSLGARAAEEGEETVDLSKIPEAAAKAIKEHAKGAKIVKIQKETDDGVTAFEAELEANGKTSEVSVDAEGKLLAVETVIELAAAPELVQAAIKKQAGGGKIEKLEKIEENGKVTYEALLARDGKREEIQVDGSGKIVKTEKKEADEDKDDGDDKDDDDDKK